MVGFTRLARGIGRRVPNGVVPRVRRRIVAGFVVAACAACGAADSAVTRGDRLWADSSYSDALAEYLLAVRQGGGDEVLARVAHTYGRVGQLEAMRETYRQLLERSPEYADQAVYDFLDFAYRSWSRGDQYGMAGAVEAALAVKPDLAIGELASPLAQYHDAMGNTERALEYYERALVQAGEEATAEILYQIGVGHEKQGRCLEAIGFFEFYQERAPTGRFATDARWHTGNCAFSLGRAARQAGRPTEALAYLERVLDLGVPENLQDQAWFEHGEVLFGLGRKDEALNSYQRVIQLNPARTGQLVQSALRRIDQIRFGF